MRWYRSMLLAVVAWGVGRDALMPGAVQDAGEVLGAVAAAVIGDDPLDAVDPVRGEPDPGPVHELDCRDGLFITERFGVRQPGASVDGGCRYT